MLNKKMIDGLRLFASGVIEFCDGYDLPACKRDAPVPTVTTPNYGSFTDDRDGQTYRTVKMPDGKVWMAQNLNYKPESGGSWAYDNEEANREKYGLLYDWATANAIAPDGYHLPSRAEWQALADACGGESTAGGALKAKSGWKDYDGRSGNGTDDYGFAALPGGLRYSDGSFGLVGYNGFWWTATEDGSDFAYCRDMDYDDDYLGDDDGIKDSGFSVRCIGDK